MIRFYEINDGDAKVKQKNYKYHVSGRNGLNRDTSTMLSINFHKIYKIIKIV